MSRRYRIETFGCQMNHHDSEQMAGLVVTEGTRASAREMLRARRGESEGASKGERRKRS